MIYLKTFEEAEGKTITSITNDSYGGIVILFTDNTALALEGGESIGGDPFVRATDIHS